MEHHLKMLGNGTLELGFGIPAESRSTSSNGGDKVQELCSKGYSQREVSQILQVGLATVNRDILSPAGQVMKGPL